MTPRTYNWLVIGSMVLALVTLIAINTADLLIHPRITAVVTADPELGWRFLGQRNQRELGFGDFVLRFDSLGLRQAEQTRERLRDRVIFVGNSVTLGQQVGEEQTFAALLGGINAGGDGYDTYQQLTHFRRNLADLKPRRVVLVVVGVDLMTLAASQVRRRTTTAENPDLASWFHRLTDIRNARIVLPNLMQAPMPTKPDNPHGDGAYLRAATSKPTDSTWHDWSQAVADFSSTLGHGRLVLVLSPPRAQVAAWREGQPDSALANVLAAFCAQHQIVCIDLLPYLANQDPTALYVDHVHFSARGHAAVAAALRQSSLFDPAGQLSLP